MYPIPDAAKALFECEQRQILRITGADRNGVSINVTDADVQINGFNIDRYSCNGSRLEIGTAVSAEMTLNLDNRDGRFDGVIFEGAELFVEVGIADWSQADPTVYWIPCGYYTPDEQPRSLNTITIHALDRMMRFDVAVPQLGTPAPWVDADGNKITDANGNVIYFYPPVSNFPCTVEMLVRQACDICGLELAESIASLTNSQYMVRGLPDVNETVTFRNLIQWAAGLMGTNAYIDWNGQLRFDWYDGTSVYTTTTANRFSSDLYENDIAFTGVTFTDISDVLYQAGTADYALDLTGNYLIDSNTAQTAINALYARIGQFTYRPFEATVINAPWLWPMDAVTFTDKGGVQHASALTNINFTTNGNTVLKSSGETDKTSSYVPPSSFTPRQAQALERARASTTAEIGTAVDNATRQITGADGGYVRFIYDANNVLTEIVIMDTDDIDTATKVWRWNSGGFGYSSTGYAGPYTTAITQDGSIVADFITSGELSAERIAAGTITLAKLDSDAKNALENDEQIIYKSQASNAAAPAANTTWVTNATGNQNTWTTVRPEYSTSYPKLYTAKQKKTAAQASGTTCSCTTPTLDKTTTVIDGGNIITGTVSADAISATSGTFNTANIPDLTADKISGGTLKSTGTAGGDNNFLLNLNTALMQMVSQLDSTLNLYRRMTFNAATNRINFGFKPNTSGSSYADFAHIMGGMIGTGLPTLDIASDSSTCSVRLGRLVNGAMTRGMTVPQDGAGHVQITGGLDVDGRDIIDATNCKIYSARGTKLIASRTTGKTLGAGQAKVCIVGRTVIVNFAAKITDAGDPNANNVYDIGIAVARLRALNSNIPVFNAVNGGQITYYDADGKYSSMNGYGGEANVSTANNRWNFARMYTTSGDVGSWADDHFLADMTITGTLYGSLD